MGTMNIAVDAKAADKAVEFSFEWEGDHQEIERSMTFVKDLAARNGVTQSH